MCLNFIYLTSFRAVLKTIKNK